VSGEFAGRKNFTGTVLGAGDDIVRLTLDDKREVSIDLADVDKANIQPTW
jgi:ribosome maturation factor RimP